MVATIIVVWMGIPFVAFTLYAGLTQIPKDIEEAAAIDGAGPWQRFRDVVAADASSRSCSILTALSVLWDFRVFTQIYVLQRAGGINRETNLLGVYAYRISIGENRFDVGAAVAIVMVVHHAAADARLPAPDGPPGGAVSIAPIAVEASTPAAPPTRSGRPRRRRRTPWPGWR